jgi:hypothetical protein
VEITLLFQVVAVADNLLVVEAAPEDLELEQD